MLELDEIKDQLGIHADTLALSDVRPEVPDGDPVILSPWEKALSNMSLRAVSRLSSWSGLDLSQQAVIDALSPIEKANLEEAQLLLVKAEIVRRYAVQENLDPEDVRTGGTEGIQIKQGRLKVADRAAVSSALIEDAYYLVKGESIREFSAVL